MDHSKVEAFLGQFVTDAGATGAAGLVVIGHRLGLYRALAEGPATDEQFAEISETVDTDFQWLPFMDYVYSTYEDTMGAVIAGKGDIAAALDEWQDQLVSYAEDQGFTVE